MKNHKSGVVLSILLLLQVACSSTTIRNREGQPDYEGTWTSSDEVALKELDSQWQVHAAEELSSVMEKDLLEEPAPEPKRGNYLSSQSHLEIYIFSIGQADSMLIVGPPPQRKTALVDLGKPGKKISSVSATQDSAKHIYERLIQITGKPHVDYFLLTHYHSDHSGLGAGKERNWGSGIIGLLSSFSVDFSIGEFIHTQDLSKNYMKADVNRKSYMDIKNRMPLWLQYNRVKVSSLPQFGIGQVVLGPGTKFDIQAYAGAIADGSYAQDRATKAGANYSTSPGNENDLCIAFKISIGNFELFSAGDLNGTDDPNKRPYYVNRNFGRGKLETYTNVEKHLVTYWQTNNIESDVEIFRANHHGSEYSNTKGIIDALDPEVILYSTGGSYGHPKEVVVTTGAKTARQYATSKVSNPSIFSNSKGELVGEIQVAVLDQGRSYTINGKSYRTFSDYQESKGDDVNSEN